MSLSFLMCSERSGSNFITKLLNAHSNVCGPSTKHIFNPVLRNLFRYGNLSCEDNWNVFLEDLNNLINVDFSVWKEEFSLNKLRAIATIGDVDSLLKNIFLLEAKASNKQHVFIKENQIYEFLPFLLLNYPESKFVYQCRDPRDMALSWKKNPSHRGGVVSAARQWKIDQQNFLKSYNALKFHRKAILVRYEDLITDTPKEIKIILNFLGVNYEEGILDFYKDPTTKKNAEKQSAWRNLSKSVITNNKNKFLNELTEEEIKIIESLCFYEMRHLGYEPINSKTNLDKITNNCVDSFHKSELNKLEYCPPSNVLINMEAKSAFYRK